MAAFVTVCVAVVMVVSMGMRSVRMIATVFAVVIVTLIVIVTMFGYMFGIMFVIMAMTMVMTVLVPADGCAPAVSTTMLSVAVVDKSIVRL